MQAPVLPPTAGNRDEHDARAETVVCLSKMPPFHPAALKLLNISSVSTTAIEDFETVFRSDPALTGDLLLVANSPLFGNRSRIATIRHALAFLGLERVRSLATTIAVGFFVRNQPRSGYIKEIWAHGIATAVIAETLGGLLGLSELYTAGLTHDLGRLAMLLTIGPAYEKELTAEFADIGESTRLEYVLFGMDHGEAGATVGHRWGFPDLLRTCMSDHHESEPGPVRDPLAAIQLACRMADSLGFPEVHSPEEQPPLELPDVLAHRTELAPERLTERIAVQVEAVGR